jgi:hypothetical protein
MEAIDKPRNANDIQVGGKHYKSNYQHWDFVRDMQLDYFLGCATKYITRRKVSRVEDLKKAHHFLTKKYEIAVKYAPIELTEEGKTYVKVFSLENRLSYREYCAVRAICECDYSLAISHVEHLIEELK